MQNILIVDQDGNVLDAQILLNKTKVLNASGTSLQGYVDVTYKKLVEVFGKPNAEGDEYKTDAEWLVYTPFGVATIYNYKDGKNYNGADGLDVEDITDWHVGGHSKIVVDVINKVLTK